MSKYFSQQVVLREFAAQQIRRSQQRLANAQQLNKIQEQFNMENVSPETRPETLGSYVALRDLGFTEKHAKQILAQFYLAKEKA